MINFSQGDSCFNYRSVAVIVENDRVLLQQAADDDYWVLPGGRVEFFEFSSETITRELLEETGLSCRVLRPLWFVESFFFLGGKKFHEVSSYFLSEFIDHPRRDIESEFWGLESQPRLSFKWQPLQGLNDINLQPEFLRTGLLELPATPQHIVRDELAQGRN